MKELDDIVFKGSWARSFLNRATVIVNNMISRKMESPTNNGYLVRKPNPNVLSLV